MRTPVVLVTISFLAYALVFWLGFQEGEKAALKKAYKVYTQQIWNHEPDEIREPVKKLLKRRR